MSHAQNPSLPVRTLAVGDVHHIDLPVRWGDMDAMGHLNNTLYFRLMEEARMQIFYSARTQVAAHTGPILAHASCDFLRPVVYPAMVRVIHRVAAIGRASLTMDLLLTPPEDQGKPYASGRNVLVWMDYQANRSEPWPPALLQHFGTLMLPAPEEG